MEKEILQLDDLRVVATLADSLVLLVKKEDTETPGVECIQLSLDKGEYTKSKIDLFLKFTPYEGVDVNSENIQEYYRQLIYRKIKDRMILDILLEFNKDE